MTLVNNLTGFASFYLFDVDDMMSDSAFALYGGVVNFTLITVAAIVVAILGVYLSDKEMSRLKDQ